MPPSCALLGGFAIGARVALLWQHNANPNYKLASIPRYDDILRTLGGVCARCWLVAGNEGGVLKVARRIWEVDVAGWPVTGRRRGRSQHYCGGLDCGLPMVVFWRQNVSEYMLDERKLTGMFRRTVYGIKVCQKYANWRSCFKDVPGNRMQWPGLIS